LGKIWIRPIDYRDATSGTAFDAYQARNQPIYRRQLEREAFVDPRVRKRALLEG